MLSLIRTSGLKMFVSIAAVTIITLLNVCAEVMMMSHSLETSS